MKNIVAIIPARKGSKTIPGKNIKKFAGKPLIAWSIMAAKASKYVDRVIVSTDSATIARIARRYNAETPFLRPQKLAGDSVGLEPVLQHAYEWLRANEGYEADAIVLVLPTNPARKTKHINNAIKIFLSTNADSVVCVNETPANHTPYWTLTRSKDGRVTLWDGSSLKKIITRRQDFPKKCYARNDLVYVIRPKNLYDRAHPNLYGDKVELYILPDPEKYDVDINTPGEWRLAEEKFKRL